MKPLIFVLTGILAASLFQSPKKTGWRGLIPLKSTRTQVERELGAFDLKCQCYRTEAEIVHVDYATGRCTGQLPGWNVPPETVLSITLSPTKNPQFSELETNLDEFVKTVDDTVTAQYGNANTGIRYSVSTAGLVTEIKYSPTINDNELRCPGFPPTDGGITSYRPYHEFHYNTVEDLTSSLGEFGIRLSKSPQYKGYVVVYAGIKQKDPRVGEFANSVTTYLIQELQIRPAAIKVINGGYREAPTVELFLLPKDWPAPVPSPSFPGVPD